MRSSVRYTLAIIADLLGRIRSINRSLIAMLASLLQVSHPHTHSHAHPSSQSHSPHSPQLQPSSASSLSPHQSKDVVGVQITPISESMLSDNDPAMDTFLAEVRGLFEAPLQSTSLHAMSRQLQTEFREKLQASNMCMLPSFHHTLPTGQERGTILALDVGGSTFRIALIDLTGREPTDDGMNIRQLKSFRIDNTVRALRGRLFFDWVAARIEQVLDADHHKADGDSSSPLTMALAWSFPIEQTSTRTGTLMAMGKGFLATSGIEGHDLCELVTSACQARKLNVTLQAIVNDSSATLLSQAYRDPSIRISLIMGTGINSAIYLPVASLDREKFGEREQSWWEQAENVLVNTELSMFGKDVWHSTRWDTQLNSSHPLPDFQPLEYKAGGRFLGELARLVIVEAVEKGVLFDGHMPKGLDVAYTLDTGLIGLIESDNTSTLSASIAAFTQAHPLPNSTRATSADMQLIRSISSLITTRAAAYAATAVHALWELQGAAESTQKQIATGPNGASAAKDCRGQQEQGLARGNVAIACNGSIMEKYPRFKTRCQAYLDELARLSLDQQQDDNGDGRNGQCGGGDGSRRLVTIEMANESSIFGAAVAAVEA